MRAPLPPDLDRRETCLIRKKRKKKGKKSGWAVAGGCCEASEVFRAIRRHITAACARVCVSVCACVCFLQHTLTVTLCDSRYNVISPVPGVQA